MALVTGLPNFYNQANPVASDFNNAAKAILSQVGGVYYDEGLSAYALALGNLDSTNLSASPAFRNSQKAEPTALYGITAGTSSQGSLKVAVFAPITTAAFFYALAITPMNAMQGTTVVDVGVLGGTATIYQNGMPVITVGAFDNRPVTTNDTAYARINLQASPGDLFVVDMSQVTYQAAGTIQNSVSLIGTTVHTR